MQDEQHHEPDPNGAAIGVDLTDLDLFSDGFPDAVFTRLRREAPVWWHRPTAHTPDDVGFWVVSRHADIMAVAADPGTYSSERGPGADGGGTILQDLPYGFAPGVLLNMTDDPLHQRIRRLVTPSVAPRALALMEGELRRRAARGVGILVHGRQPYPGARAVGIDRLLLARNHRLSTISGG